MTEEQKRLIEDNHNLIYGFLHKNKLDPEDYYDLAAIGLCKAAIGYDETVSKCSSFAYSTMFNECMLEKRKDVRKSTVPSAQILYSDEKVKGLDDTSTATYIDTLPSADDVVGEVLLKVSIEEFLANATEREKGIINSYLRGLRTPEVCEENGISHTIASRVKSKFLKYLKS